MKFTILSLIFAGLLAAQIHDKNGYNVTCLYGMSPVDTGRKSERGIGAMAGFWCNPDPSDSKFKTQCLESALRSARIQIRAAEIAIEALTKRIEKLEEKRK